MHFLSYFCPSETYKSAFRQAQRCRIIELAEGLTLKS